MKYITSPRIQKAQFFIYKMSQYLEIICAIVLIVAILIAFLTVPENLISLFEDNGFELADFIKKSFDLVIGVELLKMFCRHDIDSIVEVLLFAVARQIVIEHMPPRDILVSVFAIAILFAIRRFLFVSALDDPSKAEERLEKDEYIHHKVAEAISQYRKEAASTSAREMAKTAFSVDERGIHRERTEDDRLGPE